ncbi:MAG: V-type ATP synthase subunit I [Oscillospiraceae bacterium]|nr:V-type ATP synthase subunit I [Oscillospiraceae bacterium]
MAIVKMKHLRLVAMRQDRQELLHQLQRMGCVEIDTPRVDRDDPVWSGVGTPDEEALVRARQRREQGERALDVLNRYAPDKGGRKPVLRREELFDEQSVLQGEQAAQAVLDAQRELAALQAQRGKLEAQLQSLRPWLALDVPLDIASTGQVQMEFGTLPGSVDFAQAQGQLQLASPLAELTCAHSEPEQHYALLVYHASAGETLAPALRELGWNRVNLRGWSGTAQANHTRLEQELRALDEQLSCDAQQLAGLGRHREQLQLLVDRAAVDMEREEGRSRLLDLEQTFYLEGWVPQDSWQRVTDLLNTLTCAWELSDPAPEEYEQVPVKLKNNWLTRPLNMVTEMYVYPAYDGLDPNPLMAPFFILFFGLMMADMAYGLIMLLGGWYLLKKLHATGTMGHMGGLMVLCGVSTFAFGAMTGGFLGDFIPQIAKLINPESNVQLPYLFTPLTDTLAILVGSLVLGLIQIITGMAISVVYQCRNGRWQDALWNEITWWVVLTGAALAILGIANVAGYPVVLFVGLAMLVYGGTRNAKGFGKVTALIGTVYNGVSGYFSDILSYARLMALMLAGAVIAQVFNTLGSVTGSVIGFVIISLLGNTLNLALNLLGCYVHDLRLQCLEFFGRFYKEGGRPFNPMKINTKYVDIIKEEN